MSLDFLPEKFDVIHYDSVGTPFMGTSPRHHGLGGSEFEAVLLLENLAKHNLDVISFNNTPVAAFQHGVHYFPLETLQYQKFKCKTLIVERSSLIPNNLIEFEKLIIWATDIPGDAYKHLDQWLAPQHNTTLIAVSKWHASLFPENWKKGYIYNMIPDWVYDFKASKDNNLFIYASAAQKGLLPTVECFKELKKNYFFKKSELLSLSPGYDDPQAEFLKKNKVQFVGSVPFNEVVKHIARCGSLLYVNTFPETFGISPVLAEVLGCNTFVFCPNGFGALKETMNSPLVEGQQQAFFNRIMEFGKNPKSMPKVSPKDYKVSTIMPQWLDLVK